MPLEKLLRLLDEIVEAHRCMEENRAGGKIVVLTGGKERVQSIEPDG